MDEPILYGGNYEATVTLKIRTYSLSKEESEDIVTTQLFSAFGNGCGDGCPDDIGEWAVTELKIMSCYNEEMEMVIP